MPARPRLSRRRLLQLGATLGTATGAGLAARWALLPPAPSRRLLPVDDLARRLVDSLDAEQRARACFPWDHPVRQYHNRGVAGAGMDVDLATFTRAQRGILTDLFHAGLSAAGRERVPRQFFLRWPGVQLMRLAVCGDPHAPPYQVLLTGPHLNLRLGGACAEGVAFGGPQVYGDQRGNGRRGLPGNVYRYQLELGERLRESLTPAQRAAALLPREPVQTEIGLRGTGGAFPGLPLADLSAASRERARAVVDGILSTWRDADAAVARECLAEQGGVDALSVAWFDEGEDDGRGTFQRFRLEGPAAVLYFRGWPHVHAFVHVARPGAPPLSVGELLGDNPAPLEGAAVQALFERAMREQAGTDLAWYDPESVAGRLRAGPVRTGDVWVLESWQDAVVVVEARAADLRPELAAALRARGAEPAPDRRVSIATTDAAARALVAETPAVATRRTGVLLRDATIAYVQRHGFAEHG